jgi:hypothetical protein
MNAYSILVGKAEGKGPLGRPKRWWVDDIKIDFREKLLDCVYLTQERDQWRTLAKTGTDIQIP